jgi:hypothetical protein
VTQRLGEFITAKEANDMKTEVEAIKAQAQLDMLERALKEYDVAKFLVDTQGIPAVSEALRRVEAAHAENDENMNDDDADPLSLRQALKHRAAPTGARSPTDGKMIKLGVNRSKVSFSGQDVRKNPTKSYDDAVGRVENISKSMAEDENCVPWKRRNASSSQVAMVKKAVLRSREAQKEGFEGHFTVSESTAAMLRAHIARKASLKEGTLTPAQRSISAHPSAAERSPKIPARVPSEFDSAAQRAADTKARIPAEFRPKITPTEDKSFGAMARSTKAASTLKNQPNHEKSTLDDNKNYGPNGPRLPDVDGMTGTELPQPNVKGRTPNYVGPVGAKSNFPNKEKNWDVSLRSPKPPKQQFDPIDGAI